MSSHMTPPPEHALSLKQKPGQQLLQSGPTLSNSGKREPPLPARESGQVAPCDADIKAMLSRGRRLAPPPPPRVSPAEMDAFRSLLCRPPQLVTSLADGQPITDVAEYPQQACAVTDTTDVAVVENTGCSLQPFLQCQHVCAVFVRLDRRGRLAQGRTVSRTLTSAQASARVQDWSTTTRNDACPHVQQPRPVQLWPLAAWAHAHFATDGAASRAGELRDFRGSVIEVPGSRRPLYAKATPTVTFPGPTLPQSRQRKLHTERRQDILMGQYPLGFALADDRPITNAVKYRVVYGVVWTNRTMVSSNTDTNRTGVLAVVDM
ncbi:hypothetical protein PR048_030380 [Dryococelus australis]|uniref:Uncharacterized protein n=1 Tax=Dryococelus australis TaxID=614101 RepID=A0ABQ9G8T9_9NEOP|nr:hypothetical protein PR048_030380 [Dryococelus australis]